MILAVLSLLAAMSSADAIAIILNSSSATGVRTFEAAKAMVEREAEEGKPLQQFVIGVTTEDKDLAKLYLTASRERIRNLAEKKNNPLAWYLLSMESNDITMLLRAVDGGNVQALNAIGMIGMQEALNVGNTGLPVEQREIIQAKSFGYFSKAAAKRDPNGFINLGTCYLRGYGCKPDQAMAFSCFRAAAEAGHPEGMDNMSACYQFGHGVKKNNELSLYWQMRGRAVRGDEAAAKWLKERQ